MVTMLSMASATAQSNYGTGGTFDPVNPPVPAGNGFYQDQGLLVLDALGNDDFEYALYRIMERYAKNLGTDFIELCEEVKTVEVRDVLSFDSYQLNNLIWTFPNLVKIDFSRAYGEAFGDFCLESSEDSKLTTLILPDCTMGVSTMMYLTSLAEVYCYAELPPTVNDHNAYNFRLFHSSSVTVYVPRSSVEFYKAAEFWKDCNIVPMDTDVSTIKVNLPTTSSSADAHPYRNMNLLLTDEESGSSTRYVVTDRDIYYYPGLKDAGEHAWTVSLVNRLGTTIASKSGITVSQNSADVTLTNPQPIHTASVSLASGGNDIAIRNNITISWYDMSGNRLTGGTSLAGLVQGDQVQVEVQLPSSMLTSYKAPHRQVVTMGDGDTPYVVNLEGKNTITIQAKVRDADTHLPLQNVWMYASQSDLGNVTGPEYIRTDAGGVMQFDLKVDDNIKVTFSCDGYISKDVAANTAGVPDHGVLDLGDIELKQKQGVTVNLTLEKADSGMAGQLSANRVPLFNDDSDLDISVYNDTKGAPISDVTVLLPQVILGTGTSGVAGSVEEGDELTLTVSSRSDAFDTFTIPVQVTGTTLSAYGLIPERGGFLSTFRRTDNEKVAAILYDGDGNYVDTYYHSNATLRVNGLRQGTYTLITMAAYPSLDGISTLDAFLHSGVVENDDYVKNEFEVVNGQLTQIVNETIPTFDVDAFSIILPASTFSLSDDELIQGSYLVVKSRLKLKEEYAEDWHYSNFTYYVDMPDGCELLDGSVLVDGREADYDVDGHRVSVDVNYKLQDEELVEIRLCLIPLKTGKTAITGMLGYDYDYEEGYACPVGSAVVTVSPVTYHINEYSTGNAQASGQGPDGTVIRLYDGETLIGQTQVAGRLWSIEAKMPGNYSGTLHQIHVESTTPDGNLFKSPTTVVVVSKERNHVKKVRMLYDNAYMQETEDIYFGFEARDNKEDSYDFYPQSHDFTFLIDFQKNDTTEVRDVELDVLLSGGKVVTCPAVFDAGRGQWVARLSISMINYENEMPIDVSVYYSLQNLHIDIDRDMITDVREEVRLFAEEYNREVSAGGQAMNDEEWPMADGVYAEATEWFDRWNGLPDEERKALADELLRSIDLRHDSLSTIAQNAMQGISGFGFGGNGESVMELEDGSRLIVNDCSAWNEADMESLGFTRQEVTDGGYIYLLEANDRCVTVDFEGGTAVTIIYGNPASRGVKKSPFAQCEQVIKTVSDAVERVSGALNDMLKTLGKTAAELADVLHRQQIDDAALDMILSCDHLSAAERAGYMAAKAKNRLDMAATQMALKVAGKMPPLVRKLLPLASYIALAADITANVQKLCALYSSIPNPCEDDPVGAMSCANECDDAAVIYAAYTSTKLILQVYGDIAATGGIVASAATGGASALAAAATYLAKTAAVWAADWAFDKQQQARIKMIEAHIAALECDKDDDDPQPQEPQDPGTIDRPRPPIREEPYPSGRKRPLIDPSGFVCEAVESNRLEGVTATCYYKTKVEDAYGETSEQVLLWDAENYGQQNPLLTDSRGMYSWMVPVGQWMVVYEKEGYETEHSDWLPVPPPQLDVNVGMTRRAQPSLTEAQAYNQGIDFGFDLYMDLGSITDQTVRLMCDGKAIEGTLKAINGEKAFDKDDDSYYDDEKPQYASRFRFEPNSPLTTNAKVTLHINGAARSYAGISLGNDIDSILVVSPEIKSIGIENGTDIRVPYGSSHQVVIAAQPAAAAAFRKVNISVMTDEIASLETPVVTLDSEGKAYITVSGLLPGTTFLDFAVSDSRVSGQTAIHVTDADSDIPSAPRSSLYSGTYVAPGQTVTLTADEGCTIYYTLDGSCPCDEAHRILYTGPITITADMTLRAIAVSKDGAESETVTFKWFVPTAISDVKTDLGKSTSGIYDLSGRRHNKAQKGINIVDGVATMIK